MIARFKPKTKKAKRAMELWDHWVQTRVTDVDNVGYFISAEAMLQWDQFLVEFVTEMARVPDGQDF